MAYQSQNYSHSTGSLALDADGIPVLADVVVPAFPTESATSTTSPDNRPQESLPESVTRLLEQEHVRQMIEDLSSDLQVEISWKIEENLKHSMNRLLHEALEANSRQILESIQTQLRLTLPELLLNTLSEKD